MFVNENTGWVCGSANGPKNLFKTTNSGENWVLQTNPVCEYYYRQLNGILFINPDTGWASSYVGLIIVTTNGGTNWVVDYSGEESNKFSSYNYKIWCGGFFKIFYTILDKPNGINKNQELIPIDFTLFPNYPNPFNNQTILKFELNKKSVVKIRIFNVNGQQIEVITDKEYTPGTYKFLWNADNYPSGIYFCKCETETLSKAVKMIFLK